MLAGEFCHAVGRNGRGQVGLDGRIARRVAVERRRRGIHNADVARTAGFEQALRREDIAARIDFEFLSPRGADARLRRLVKHHLNAIEQAPEIGHGQIGFMELEGAPGAQRRQIAFLDSPRVVVDEAIDPPHGIAALNKRIADRGTEKSGRAGN